MFEIFYHEPDTNSMTVSQVIKLTYYIGEFDHKFDQFASLKDDSGLLLKQVNHDGIFCP